MGAILADPKGQLTSSKTSLEPAHVERLEDVIDELDNELSPLKQFILPGGSKGAALLHQARAVCRRAERKIVELAANESVPEVVVAYVNRLSDLLFVLARLENRHQNIPDKQW